MAQSPTVERPHWAWWLSIILGLGLCAVLGFSEGAFSVWAARVTSLLPMWTIRAIFVVALGLHIGEAIYAWHLCQDTSHEASANGWFMQTLVLGFPSLRLLRRRLESESR